VSIGGQ
jgi:hypothetical protein